MMKGEQKHEFPKWRSRFEGRHISPVIELEKRNIYVRETPSLKGSFQSRGKVYRTQL